MKRILILALATLLAGPSFAQTRTKDILGIPGGVIHNPIPSAATSAGLGESNVMTALAKPFQDLATFISSDAQGAIVLSTQISALQDGHGQQCWIAMTSAGDVFKAHPVPLTLKVMTDLESLRLLEMAANNLCSNVHCTQVFADLSALAQAISPLPLAIPTLHDLCGKIPQVAMVAPVTYTAPTTPVVTPTPTPVPAPVTPTPQ